MSITQSTVGREAGTDKRFVPRIRSLLA